MSESFTQQGFKAFGEMRKGKPRTLWTTPEKTDVFEAKAGQTCLTHWPQ